MDVAGNVSTGAGMCALWSPASFASVVDYDTWAAVLLEDADIVRQISAGVFVPINVGGDGAFGLIARVGSDSAPAELTERERRYVATFSLPYLFVSAGEARVGGFEQVGSADDSTLQLRVPAGRWSVTVALIGWDDEPGQVQPDGLPAPTALPDFVVLMNPEPAPSSTYRTNIRTFDPPSD